jgi:hypothetical protein
MGFDTWLPSIFDFNDEQDAERVLGNVDIAGLPPMARVARMYDAMRATGGYYREGYNGRGLLTLMGMSWHQIMADLESPGVLPPTYARHLLAELEMRPFTKAMLFEEERRDDHVEVVLATKMQQLDGRPTRASTAFDHSDQQIEEAFRNYVERRQGLIALLRTAIERNESLRVSG